MERIVEQALLYDFYGELLTEHQKKIYGDYVQNDLSPSEIAMDHGITRQAAYDMIRRCNKILAGYEEKLHLLQKFLKTKEMVSRINVCAKDILEQEQREEVIDKLEEIENISNAILEEY
ncbi:MAG: DNA-binding protein [Lachnospiraceae bacterium]|nr:DNA-binding protein [Lachnospiraceae bacterium]